MFFFKHDNNPQIPNNVIESIKKKPPVFTILVSIKMSNFHEELRVLFSVPAAHDTNKMSDYFMCTITTT